MGKEKDKGKQKCPGHFQTWNYLLLMSKGVIKSELEKNEFAEMVKFGNC